MHQFWCFENFIYACNYYLSPDIEHSISPQSSLVPFSAAATAAKLLQSLSNLRNPIDGSPPGSPVPGILHARTLEWVAISFSNAWKWKVKVKSLSCVWLLATPWTAAFQALLSMGFSRQEYWSGLPLPSPTQRQQLQLKACLLDTTNKYKSLHMKEKKRETSKNYIGL